MKPNYRDARSQDKNYYPDSRFTKPIVSKQYESPYDMPSEELQDLAGRQTQAVVFVQTLNLGVKQLTPLRIGVPGQAACIFGHDGSIIRTVNTKAYVAVQFNQFDQGVVDTLNNDPVTGQPQPFGYPLKHARGFRGPFKELFLTWPIQAGVYADIVIYKNKEMPWIDGESAT